MKSYGFRLALVALWLSAGTALAQQPEQLLLKNYRPKSIYRIPVTHIERAKFAVVDMHTHPYAKTQAQLQEWIRTMDAKGVEKSIILTYSTG